MKFGLNLRDFLYDPERSIYSKLEDTAAIVRDATSLGLWGAYMPQHWMSHPTIWLQPIPVLARLAPENSNLKLITGIVLLPLHNPVQVADEVATMDHLTNGRFILGVGLGYRDVEFEVAGTSRKERVSRFRESIQLMKLLWSGEEVTFEGKHWKVRGGRLGLTPVQQPHPPIWIACQSPVTARRSATLGDGCLLGPRIDWPYFQELADTYWRTVHEAQVPAEGFLASHRCISIAPTRQEALQAAQEKAEASAHMYGSWRMQEPNISDLGLSSTKDLSEWAIVGTPEECAETIARCKEEMKVDYMGLTFLNLPRDPSQRGEYLQYVSEELRSRFA